MKYSIYVFLDQRNRPYYVGKTNNFKRRKREHLDEIKGKNPLPKYRKARWLRKKGYKFRMRTIAKAMIESDAYAIERTLIKEYSKRGYDLKNVIHGNKTKKRRK